MKDRHILVSTIFIVASFYIFLTNDLHSYVLRGSNKIGNNNIISFSTNINKRNSIFPKKDDVIDNSNFSHLTIKKNEGDNNRTKNNNFIFNLEMIGWEIFRKNYMKRFHQREPPSGMEIWLKFAKSNQCSLQEEDYQSIDDDMEYFRQLIINKNNNKKFLRGEILANGLEVLKKHPVIVFQLQQHKIHVVSYTTKRNKDGIKVVKEVTNYTVVEDKNNRRVENFYRLLLEPIRLHEPPINAIYIFNLADGPVFTPINRPTTISFSFCRVAYWTDNITPPTDEMSNELYSDIVFGSNNKHNTNSSYSWQKQHNYLYNKNERFYRNIMLPYHRPDHNNKKNYESNTKPFFDRKDTILWRGTLIGPSVNNYDTNHRGKLLTTYGGVEPHYILDDVPVMVDFGYTKIQKGEERNIPPTTMRFADRVEYKDAKDNKYIMDVDGNAFTERFVGQLNSESIIFKSTKYREWYTDRVRPFIDYIPVNYNLSDLPEKIKWAHDHPKTASAIATHAGQTVQKSLRQKDRLCYVYRLLLEYQELFTDK